MFGGDYPHCEGLADPYRTYSARVGHLPASVAAQLYGDVAAKAFNIAQAKPGK
jgi:hypothetical protein